MRNKRRVNTFKIIGGLAAAVALVVGYLAGSIWFYGYRTTHASAQAAIVLGAAAWGNKPSPVFQERINHAITLYREGKVQKLLFTGGQGARREPAESEVARHYAQQRGVPAADILTEAKSHTTYENLRYARQVAEQHGLRRFVIVSDPLHMRRALTMARDMGMEAYPSPTPTTRYRTFSAKAGFLFHETYYYAGYLLQHPF
jgi:uncharacterized SAM-binding protein YcdF (DUF218 family)